MNKLTLKSADSLLEFDPLLYSEEFRELTPEEILSISGAGGIKDAAVGALVGGISNGLAGAAVSVTSGTPLAPSVIGGIVGGVVGGAITGAFGYSNG